MKNYFYKNLSKSQIDQLTTRPVMDLDKTFKIVKPILNKVKKNGDEAVKFFTKKFDGQNINDFVIQIKDSQFQDFPKIDQETRLAFEQAAKSIEKFHKSQLQKEPIIETMPGVTCFRENRPIEKVGIYIPGGTAPLPSTVLMLAIPAKLAGCKEVILCTPPPVAPEIIFAAKLCGIKKIYQIGGAQAIAAMAYGTETIPRVYKIFGPGNQYVTAAKMLVSVDGVAIDMPAGPSEVLVIADQNANPEFVAADLLSQAEHGPDSQVVLVSLSGKKAAQVIQEIKIQLKPLPRKEIAEKALGNSFALICENLQEAFDFSNQYAPEHLILNLENSEKYLNQVINAGSVFLGKYSCESAGDYASGTNHTLPTYGYAKTYSGVSVDSFVKKITFQKLTAKGVQNIGLIVEKMAASEGLEAHKRAMILRIQSLENLDS